MGEGGGGGGCIGSQLAGCPRPEFQPGSSER